MNNIESASYRRTDLAIETDIDTQSTDGISFTEYERDTITVSVLEVERGEGEKTAGRPAGKYVTVTARRPWLWDDDRRSSLISLLSDLISDAVASAAGERPRPDFPILVCGLGNRAMTADAIGPKVADAVTVTSQLAQERPDLYRELACCRVSASAPGVAAATGIEAADIVRGIADAIRPSVVILIDALAARSCSRLASTIQITDTGISPGSGIGNRRRALNSDTLGVPVVTIGVPTVVDSSTLVYDALDAGGVDLSDVPDALRDVLENGRSFFVTPKESDVVTEEMAGLIAEAVNRMCGT